VYQSQVFLGGIGWTVVTEVSKSHGRHHLAPRILPSTTNPFTHPQRLVWDVMSFFGAATSTTAATPDKDIEVADPPPDSISSLAFSPQADYLAVGSWDNNVRVLLTPVISR